MVELVELAEPERPTVQPEQPELPELLLPVVAGGAELNSALQRLSAAWPSAWRRPSALHLELSWAG